MTSIILEIFLLEIGQTLRLKYYNSIYEYANIVFQFDEGICQFAEKRVHFIKRVSFLL